MDRGDRHLDVDVVIVGAGFCGLYALWRLRGEGSALRRGRRCRKRRRMALERLPRRTGRLALAQLRVLARVRLARLVLE